jgi:MFS superfamily sulfate permease-like transporter
LPKHGVDIVGHITSGLPAFGLPHVPAADYLKLAGSAVGVMLVGFAEGLGAAKTYAARNGYQISPNQERIGLGAANLAAGLSSGTVGPPHPGWGRIYGFAARADVIAAIAAMPGVLIFDTLPGLVIGGLDSLLLLLYRVSRPHIAVLGKIPGSDGQWADVAHHPEDQAVPGVTVLRTESGLFFGNADHVHAVIRAAAGDGVRAVVLDCETMPSIDVTGARILGQLGADLGHRQVRLVLAGEIGQVRDVLAAVGGRDGVPEHHRTVEEAVRAGQAAPARAPAGEQPAGEGDG